MAAAPLFVDFETARRLELAQTWRAIGHANAYQGLHPEARVEIQQIGGGSAVFESSASPINRCSSLGFDGPVSEAQIEAVEQFFQRHNVPTRIHLCPLADPSLLEILRKRGYQVEMFFNVLVRTLPEASEEVQMPPGVQVRRATPELANLWLDTTALGFSAPHPPGPEVYDILGPNFYAANADCFLAYVNGEPAGGGGMYSHGGVVEFGGTSTRPEYRRRGVQAALLNVRMQTARQAGCDLGLVVTSPGSNSQRNVERMGFQIAYTKPVMVHAQAA